MPGHFQMLVQAGQGLESTITFVANITIALMRSRAQMLIQMSLLTKRLTANLTNPRVCLIIILIVVHLVRVFCNRLPSGNRSHVIAISFPCKHPIVNTASPMNLLTMLKHSLPAAKGLRTYNALAHRPTILCNNPLRAVVNQLVGTEAAAPVPGRSTQAGRELGSRDHEPGMTRMTAQSP